MVACSWFAVDIWPCLYEQSELRDVGGGLSFIKFYWFGFIKIFPIMVLVLVVVYCRYCLDATGWPYRMGCFWKSMDKKTFGYRLLAMIAMATHQNLGQSLQEEEKVPQLILTQDFKAFINRVQCASLHRTLLLKNVLHGCWLLQMGTNLYSFARCSCWS